MVHHWVHICGAIETHTACTAALSSLLLDRLQYFARGLQVYIRQLRVALQGKTGDALKTEEVTPPQRENLNHSELPLSIILFSLSRTRSKWWR